LNLFALAKLVFYAITFFANSMQSLSTAIGLGYTYKKHPTLLKGAFLYH